MPAMPSMTHNCWPRSGAAIQPHATSVGAAGEVGDRAGQPRSGERGDRQAVAVEQLLMQATQVGAGFDGQLLVEGRAGDLVGRQRLGGVAGVAVRPHQQDVPALAQRVAPQVLLEQGGRRGRLTEQQPHLRQPLDHGGLVVVDCLAAGGCRVPWVRPASTAPAPQGVRPLEVFGRTGEVAGGEGSLRGGSPLGEVEQVELFGRHVQAVAGPEADQRTGPVAGRAQQPAQIAGVGAHVGDGRGRWLVGPEFVDEVVEPAPPGRG